MGPLDFLVHGASFFAPAFVLALLLPLAGRLLARGGAGSLARQFTLVFLVGAAVLVAGLWYFGRDGKMAAYAVLVVATGTVQWLAARGWR